MPADKTFLTHTDAVILRDLLYDYKRCYNDERTGCPECETYSGSGGVLCHQRNCNWWHLFNLMASTLNQPTGCK